MCKGICSEKCNECVKLGVSCCRTLPVFSNEDAANLIDSVGYNKGILKGLTLTEIYDDTYVFVPSSMAKKSKTIVWNDRDCPFLDTKSGKCRIYKYRPKVCRVYGVHEGLPCPFEDMTTAELKEKDVDELKAMHVVDESTRKKAISLAMNIASNDTANLFRNIGRKKRDYKVTKDSLKYTVDDLILLTAWYYVNESAKGDVEASPTKLPKIFETVSHKELILGKKSQVFVTTTYKIAVVDQYKNNPGVKKFAELMNTIANIFSRFIQEKLTICVNAINAVSKGFNDDTKINAYVFAATLITRYLEDIKPKDKKYSGLITYEKLIEFSNFMDELEDDQVSIDSMKLADKFFEGFVRYLK